MGCSLGDSACDYDEKPRKRVFVHMFYMDVHETTQKEYEKVMVVNAG